MAMASPRLRGSGAELDKRFDWRWWTWPMSDGSKSGSQTSALQPNSDNGNSGSFSFSFGDVHSDFSSSPSEGAKLPSALPTRSNGPSTRVTPNPPSSKGTTDGGDSQQWLKLHNNYRVQYKAVPLKWNPTLVAASKRVTDKCLWKHTPNNRYGENIAAGQATMEDVVKGWVAGPDERDSFTGPNSKPSHFTQVVWQATTEVGCYKGMCKSVRGINIPQSPVTFWACTYNPQGNIIGQIGKNVKAAPGGRPL
ncbi:uncharacterized protein PGTG_16763 [Puccinia graminis f. sp. tritici CRL 75-36-700-3]|uniref:SCP domain-containing protein n=1 Tax=Puccinia graminis f. sp. tritici (strain CRL 75-36-700-3 / race SCCL) TaxID=418459 RepID=E3L2F0_PUCGT|nr:uncharacterized protein PGTG_16763 [Puccinia graminis f. sp. tritici CRL 75-36-700-3]EFP90737.2 hypothetical protein PGTG_16763 [Puccinia graminis f. sp. tritici CRL 75-36-700-3]